VQITNARKEVLVSRVMPAGAVFDVPQEKGIVMHAGNLGGMEIHVGSDILPRLGRTGQIGRNIRLDADILKPIENGGEKVHVDSAVPAPPVSGAAPRGGNR